MIRKTTSLVLLGAAAGIAVTLLATQPRLILGASAKAAAADTYRQLNLFGDVFERVRADYVEKPDDSKLIEQAINGMLNGLDPHSSYMDPKNSLAALQDPGRLSPAIAFAAARKTLPLPLNGIKIREFGMPDGLGGTEKGLSVASRAGAQVTAPCDGWVVYAGPFRSYGQLLILNAGGGYHVLLAGMERISVDLGQFVLTGEPVAIMGGGPQSAAAVATGSSQPILYIEFRKDGVPVDPSPWWAATDSEKVRG